MAYNEDSSASGHDEPWIQWFCGLKGHEMFCEVERAYIEDGFNLYGLRACVSNFSDCLDLILDRIGPDDSDDSHLTQNACTLYGLIHSRYIVTAHGLDSMYNKYAAKEFGICPLVQCNGQPVLPMGLKDEIGIDTVKIFCPKCQCVYQPPPIRTRSSGHHSSGGGGGGAVDGAAFGTTFPHLFLMTFNNLIPEPLPPGSAYVPRVFGFRVHRSVREQNTAGGGAILTASALSRSNNSRRGGAVDPFTSQRYVNVPVSNYGADTPLLAENAIYAPDANAEEVKDEKIPSNVNEANPSTEAGVNKTKASNGTPTKSNSKIESVNGDESIQVKEDKMSGNDAAMGNQSKRRGIDEENSVASNNENGTSKSRSSKRQKRGSGGSDVT